MPVETTTTGIFQDSKITGPVGHIERTAIKDAGSNLEENLTFWEKTARRVLREKFGIRRWPIVIEKKAGARIDLNDPQFRDAAAVLLDVRLVRRFVLQGNAAQAALHALHLGHVGTKLEVRPHEKPAKVGRFALMNLQKGRLHGEDRYGDARERHLQWRTMAASMTGADSQKAHRLADKINADPETTKPVKWNTIYKALRKNNLAQK